MVRADILLRARGLHLHYPQGREQLVACHDISFDLHRHDRLVLLGPSGCGKSTLLKAVAGFLRPQAGSLELNGRPIQGPSPDRAVVFQEFDQLLPWKTVLDNVVFAVTVSGRLTGQAARERARQTLTAVGLAPFLHAYPHTLSGGMKQRVAIARAFALQPEILLMDEPFASLDALTRSSLQQELLELSAQTRLTLLFVTHSIEEALRVGTRILLLSPHPGQVRAELHVGALTPGSIAFEQKARQIHALLFGQTKPEAQRKAA